MQLVHKVQLVHHTQQVLFILFQNSDTFSSPDSSQMQYQLLPGTLDMSSAAFHDYSTPSLCTHSFSPFCFLIPSLPCSLLPCVNPSYPHCHTLPVFLPHTLTITLPVLLNLLPRTLTVTLPLCCSLIPLRSHSLPVLLNWLPHTFTVTLSLCFLPHTLTLPFHVAPSYPYHHTRQFVLSLCHSLVPSPSPFLPVLLPHRLTPSPSPSLPVLLPHTLTHTVTPCVAPSHPHPHTLLP